MELYKMDKIPNFKNLAYVIKKEYKLRKKPTITFKSTVKLHGTFAGIAYDGTEMWAQSKNNPITPLKDNLGFANYVEKHHEYLLNCVKHIQEHYECGKVLITGEFVGKKIQKGVGVSEFKEKKYFMFGIKCYYEKQDEWVWLEEPSALLGGLENPNRNLYSIFNYQTNEIKIDFNKPEEVLEVLDNLVDKIEERCPVAYSFNISGIGEGIVCTGYDEDGNRYVFKHKGIKHRNIGNKENKVQHYVNEEHLGKVSEFVRVTVTANRLEQMLEETFDTLNGGEAHIGGTGTFLRAVYSDVITECRAELDEFDLEPKDVSKEISRISKEYLMDCLDAI